MIDRSFIRLNSNIYCVLLESYQISLSLGFYRINRVRLCYLIVKCLYSCLMKYNNIGVNLFFRHLSTLISRSFFYKCISSYQSLLWKYHFNLVFYFRYYGCLICFSGFSFLSQLLWMSFKRFLYNLIFVTRFVSFVLECNLNLVSINISGFKLILLGCFHILN